MIDVYIIENEESSLRSDNVGKCEDIIPVVKEFDKFIKCKKKGILNLEYNLKSVTKVPKTQNLCCL